MIEGHGDDQYKYPSIIANFSSNVCAGIEHQGLFRHLSQSLPMVQSYAEPVPYSVQRLLVEKYAVRPSEVLVTNGAVEAIYIIAQAFAGSRTAVLQPTFAEYADACTVHQHEVTTITNLSQVDSEEMVWLCNPNNPTGQAFNIETLTTTFQENLQTIFVIDQSYKDFTLLPTLLPQEITKLPNVLLIGSMTKRFAIPGLRLGYLIGNESLVERVARYKMPWSVNALAIEAGKYVLAHEEEMPLHLEKQLEEAQRVAQALRDTQVIEVLPTDTHFFLCRLLRGTAPALKEYLVQTHGILIRDASNFATLDNRYFRIAVQTPVDNNRLIKAITQWLHSF